jgi:hypothetical protein
MFEAAQPNVYWMRNVGLHFHLSHHICAGNLQRNSRQTVEFLNRLQSATAVPHGETWVISSSQNKTSNTSSSYYKTSNTPSSQNKTSNTVSSQNKTSNTFRLRIKPQIPPRLRIKSQIPPRLTIKPQIPLVSE